MSNHRSYIDIVLIPSLIPYVIVAKKQVGSWPIIGATGRAIKVIFVDRDSVESRRKTRADILNRLKAGYSVLIYPEGTTFKGPGILPMKPGIFSTCAAEAIPIVPVAIEFEDKSMAWIGTDTFIPHFIQAFRNWRINVSVSMGPVLKSDNSVELRAAVETWIDAETRRMA